jgi:hypothetical protein
MRHERFFVLMATGGVSPFFEQESGVIRDCRREPFKYGGYSISSKGGRVSVRIEREQYNVLKAAFLEYALRRSPERLEGMVSTLPFEPYAPVRRQLLSLVRAMNKARKAAGLKPLSYSCVRLKRDFARTFARVDDPARDSREMDGGGEGGHVVQGLPAGGCRRLGGRLDVVHQCIPAPLNRSTTQCEPPERPPRTTRPLSRAGRHP